MSNQITVKDYFHQDQVIQSFRDVLGDREANAYISSVLIAVANSNALQECSPMSIVSSAIRAATLRLSCDPGIGQAYLVPFKGKCTLIVGYKGIMDMALRTGKYRYLNVSKIFEGEVITEDRMTGMHSLTGGKESSVVIGYLLYFELMSGFRKSFYMTTTEIAEHAQRYSKSYNNNDSAWKTNRPEMERKTVLRMGLGKWGYSDPHDAGLLSQIENGADDIIDMEVDETSIVPAEPAPVRPAEEILNELGFDF